MSMEINGSYNHSLINYTEQTKAEQVSDRAEQAKEIEKGQNNGKRSDKIPVPQDEYISSEKSSVKPSGLYRLGQDGNGKTKVMFDAPKKSGDADGGGQPKIKSDSPEKPAEKCTTNTDKVDREIEKLKEEKKQLEQQIRMAAGDEKKVGELEKKLAQIEGELSQKDNDTYRRQKASVSK